MSLFSKNLRYLRKRGNYKQDEISVLFNKQANTIGNWENQKSEPNLTELIKLGGYFKVSIEDLLHIDLEKESFQAKPKIGDGHSNEKKTTYHPSRESTNSLANESDPEAFWLILREIRVLNEKVDLLISGMETAAVRKNSDKSYH